MGRFRRRMQEEFMQENTSPDARYDLAYKRVKRIKGFYIHLLVYIIVNSFIIISNYNQNWTNDENFWQWQNFSTVLFWGIGLLAHGMSVFGRNMFFGKNWEEKKIQEFMDKDKNSKWE
jgi:hypothetical protein